MSDLILDGHKLQWHGDRVKALFRGERVAPITMDVGLTRKCTYKCGFCYGQLQKNEERKITKDAVIRFMDDAVEIGVKAISFVADGEPTCSPHIYDAILRGKSNGLDIAMATNGHLLKEDRIEEILPALTYLRFNICAADEQRYNEIHICPKSAYRKVIHTIKECVRIKKERNLDVTLGMQMVLLPEYNDQIIPLAKMGKELGVDYLVIKHCSDDEAGSLKVDYEGYGFMLNTLRDAETYSDDKYTVAVKWTKILSRGKRSYDICYGPPLVMEISGTGLLAPCGMLFNSRFKKDYHIGNIAETSFKEMFYGERYWEVLNRVMSEKFNPHTMCGSLCLQHKINEYLWEVKTGKKEIKQPEGEKPSHLNFV